MEHKVVAPEVGESITEVRIIEWQKQSGEAVKEGEILLEVETDKASVEVAAPSSGVLKILKEADETIDVGTTIGIIDDAAKATVSSSTPKKEASSSPSSSSDKKLDETISHNSSPSNGRVQRTSKEDLLKQIKNLGGQTTQRAAHSAADTKANQNQEDISRLLPGESREKMTRLRAKIAENLVTAQRTAAILTTFNEVDLTHVMDLRKKHKENFQKKNGVNLGFMSFFSRACTLALKEQPLVNGSIEGEYIIKRDFVNLGIAVGTDRGLVVPVLRNADKMTFAEIEKGIVDMATKAKNGKLGIKDMSEGTFTISNGGVYGSMLSTPILNPPQSAILGMHNIMQRPVAVDGKIEIRPMMYLALSYDHRIIDGKEAVTFLVSVKRRLENPEELGLDFL